MIHSPGPDRNERFCTIFNVEDCLWISERLIYRCNLESIQRRYGLSVQEKVIEICKSMDEHGLEDWRLVLNISKVFKVFGDLSPTP